MISWFKKHYYWIIVLVMMLQTTIYGGMGNTIASIYTIPVTTDLGITRSDFALAINMRPLILFIAMTCSGPVFNKFGVRRPMLFGLTTLAISYILLSVSDTFVKMSFSCALTGLGEAFVGTAAISRVVNTWFHRYQGSLLGLITACTGLGGGIYSVALSAVIQSGGWRAARVVSAISLAVAAVVVLLLLRSEPANIGLEPFGKGYVPRQKKHRRDGEHWEGFTFQQLLRKPTFYFAAFTFFLAGVSIYSAFSTIAPHLEDRGFTATQAATFNGVMLIFLAVFKFSCGTISDVIGPKKVCCICMISAGVSLALLPWISNMVNAFLIIMLYSLSVPLTLVVISLVSYPLFGYRSHDASLGVFLAMPYLGSLVIVPITNAIYDRMGSYDLVFRISSVLAFVVLGLLLILYAWTKADQKKFLSQQTSCLQQDEV